MENEQITLREFLLTKTEATELCVIRWDGWISAAIYIDYEDLFPVPDNMSQKLVKGHEWGILRTKVHDGMVQQIEVHYVDI